MWEREDGVALANLLASATAGKGGGLFVAGEPGAGKSALLDVVRRDLARGFRVGWGQADAVETRVPFGLFGQVFRTLASRDLPEPNGSLTATVKTAPADAYQHALHFLESAAATQPVLIVVDDLHCADAESLALLAFLWRRLERMPVAIVGSFRSWPPVAGEMLARLPGGEQSVLRLTRLDGGGVASLFEERTGRAASPEDVAAILEQTRGNPLLVHELALHQRGGREVAAPIERWRRSDVRELVARFVGDADDLRAVAAAASVFGERFRPALAVRTARIEAGRARAALEALFQAGLFEPATAPEARFAHPLVRQVVYASLGPTMRAELHLYAMRALLDHGVTVSEAAEHAMLAEAAGDPAAVEVLAEAGQVALAGGDVSVARRYLEGAVAMAANGSRPRLKLLLGQVSLAAGDHGYALGLFRSLTRHRNGNDESNLARRWTARTLFVRGEVDEAEQELEVVARGAERAGDADTAARARIDQAAIALYTRGPRAALELATTAAQFARRPSQRLVTAAAAILACCQYETGDAGGLPLIASLTREMARGPADEIGPLLWGWGILGVCLHTAHLAELYRDADAAFEALFASAQRLELPVAVAALATARASQLLQRGRIDEALRLASVGMKAAERAPGLAAWAEAVNAEVLFESGQTSAGIERLRRAQDQAAGRGAPAMLRITLDHLAALFELEGGRASRASELFERVEEGVASAGVVDPSTIPWGAPAIAAHVAAGRPEAARRVLEWLERGAAAVTARHPHAMVALGRARIAEGAGDIAAAENGYDEAIRILDELPARPMTIEALLARGRLLRIQGRVRAARGPLGLAYESAQATGSGRLEAQARLEMGISGGRFRQHRDPSHLTPQESRVAALARMGLSDRDIGRKLFISQKTVETHLMRVYRKMEVTNRRELMLRRP